MSTFYTSSEESFGDRLNVMRSKSKKKKKSRNDALVERLDELGINWHVIIKKKRYEPIVLVAQTKMSAVFKVVTDSNPGKWMALKLFPTEVERYKLAAQDECDLTNTFKNMANIIQIKSFLIDGKIIPDDDRERELKCGMMLMDFADQSIESCAYQYNLVRKTLIKSQIDFLPSSSKRSSKHNTAAMFDDLNAAKFIFKQMVHCVAVCHQKYIVHRDIKPKNFVILHGVVTLIDFGLALIAEKDEWPIVAYDTLNAGTPIYLAPELRVYKDKPNKKRPEFYKTGAHTDVYALGMTLAVMVIDKNLIRCPSSFGNIKDLKLRDLLEGCLDPDPNERWTMESIMTCEWLSE